MAAITSTVILKPKKIKAVTVSILPPSIRHGVMGPVPASRGKSAAGPRVDLYSRPHGGVISKAARARLAGEERPSAVAVARMLESAFPTPVVLTQPAPHGSPFRTFGHGQCLSLAVFPAPPSIVTVRTQQGFRSF